MSLKRLFNFRHTVALQLMARYAGVFMVSVPIPFNGIGEQPGTMSGKSLRDVPPLAFDLMICYCYILSFRLIFTDKGKN